MEKYSLDKMNEVYDLDLEKAIDEIKKASAKLVLIQFPDGLKHYATSIVEYLEEKTGAEFLIWLGPCYGACDYPVGVEGLGIDLMLHLGHNSMMPSY